MYPVLLELGPIKLHTYGLMIAIGVILAHYCMQRDGKKIGVDPDNMTTLVMGSLILGIIGSRVFHIVMYPQHYSWTDPVGWIALWKGGLVFQGAIPFVLPFLIWQIRKHKYPFWLTIDAGVVWVPLGHAMGRVGCLMYGCCYGKRADDLACAIRFPQGSPAYMAHSKHYSDFDLSSAWSLPMHPTQIYAFVGLLLLCALLYLIRKKWNPFPGHILAFYAIFYGVLRFIIECFRGDDNPTELGLDVLTNQQVFCIVLFIIGILLTFYLYRRNKKLNPEQDKVSW